MADARPESTDETTTSDHRVSHSRAGRRPPGVSGWSAAAIACARSEARANAEKKGRCRPSIMRPMARSAKIRRRRRRYLRSYTATHKTPRVHRARARTGMPTLVLPGPGWSMDNKAPRYTRLHSKYHPW
eukprot:7321105-Prymnesium_polylepis.1